MDEQLSAEQDRALTDEALRRAEAEHAALAKVDVFAARYMDINSWAAGWKAGYLSASSRQPAWVACGERMPAMYERVLVTRERPGGGNVSVAKWCDNGWHSDFGYVPWSFTHWLPLPNPPPAAAPTEEAR